MIVGLGILLNYQHCFTTEFFEECIKEEQYEAEKLDILRDAVRAKATYNIETKKMGENASSSEGNSLPTSPRETSPPPTETNGIENGRTSTDVSNGDGAHANSTEQTTTA